MSATVPAKQKGLTYLKGDSAPKFTPKPGHPWRRALFPWTVKQGRYVVDAPKIDARRKRQLAKARTKRNEQRQRNDHETDEHRSVPTDTR